MDVLILGVGDAFTEDHFNNGAVIRAPEGYVMIDCPGQIHRALKAARAQSGWPVRVDDIDDILLTHLHGDHSNGLEAFGFWRNLRRRQGKGDITPRLHTNEPAAERVWSKLAPAMDFPSAGSAAPSTLDDYFELHALGPEHEHEIAGLSVRCRFTKHPVPTVGLLVSDGASTLGWSSDTPFEQAHLDWLAPADLIVHESNVGPAHTPIEQLNDLPPDVKRKMRLIHLPDDFDESRTDISVLREGEVLSM